MGEELKDIAKEFSEGEKTRIEEGKEFVKSFLAKVHFYLSPRECTKENLYQLYCEVETVSDRSPLPYKDFLELLGDYKK